MARTPLAAFFNRPIQKVLLRPPLCLTGSGKAHAALTILGLSVERKSVLNTACVECESTWQIVLQLTVEKFPGFLVKPVVGTGEWRMTKVSHFRYPLDIVGELKTTVRKKWIVPIESQA